MIWLSLVVLAFSSFNCMPVLPKDKINTQFREAADGFEKRWEKFSKDRVFTAFQLGRTDADLEQEFSELSDVRYRLWFRNPEDVIKESQPDYEVSSALFFEDAVRCKNCVAFTYNSLTPFFNASSINLNNRMSIACEGARSKDISRFFTLLASYQITHLVRLTAAFEDGAKKCHPYWEGLIKPICGNEWILQVPIGKEIHYPVHYFVEEKWRDNSGIAPEQLLELVLSVKASLDNRSNGLLAVHCSAGVGRTGTFLAALAIVDAIDNKQPFSIQEIVYRLSLQRLHSVAKPCQYVTLYRFAELYLRKISFLDNYF